MKITKSQIQKKFGDFNEKYFDGVLPPCDMRVADDVFGLGFYRRGTRKSLPSIYITRKPLLLKKDSWVESELDNVIIHEMVHFYVDVIIKHYSGFFQHGYYFRKVCKRLKKKYGLDIKRSTYRLIERKKPSTIFGWLKAFFRSFFITVYEFIL